MLVVTHACCVQRHTRGAQLNSTNACAVTRYNNGVDWRNTVITIIQDPAATKPVFKLISESPFLQYNIQVCVCVVRFRVSVCLCLCLCLGASVCA